MPTAEQELKRRIARITSVPNRFVNGVDALQSEVFAELIEILSVLDIRKGQELSTSTLRALDELMEQYYAVLKDGKYGSYVTWFVDQMQVQAQISVAAMGSTYVEAVAARSAQILEVSKQTAVRQLLGDDFKTNFVNVIRDVLTNQITAGSDFEGLVKSMRTTTFFPEGRDGQILNWAKQVASDRFSITDSAFNISVADDLGLEFFEYAGGRIPNTRKFCLDREGKYFHKKEAREWASLEWAGKNRDTTVENILEVRGGHNCNHIPMFVSTAQVPIEVIQRNIANGNYKPSNAERALLNL